jgi:hypothetical protein
MKDTAGRGTMGGWTHRCCERCWFDGPGQTINGQARLPVQVKGDPPGRCCYCGGVTVTAIYRRDDPAMLICQGNHDAGGNDEAPSV